MADTLLEVGQTLGSVPYIQSDDLPFLVVERFRDTSVVNATNKTSEWNAALKEGINTGRTVTSDHSRGNVHVVDNLDPIENEIGKQLRIQGQGAWNTLLYHENDNGYIIEQGERARTSLSSMQDARGFVMSDMGLIGGANSLGAINQEWRFSESLYERCIFQGFPKAISSRIYNPASKFFGVHYNDCHFPFNDTAVEVYDHAINFDNCRAYYNDVFLDIITGASSLVLDKCNLAAADIALIRIREGGNINCLKVNGGYTEQGYDRTFTESAGSVRGFGHSKVIRPAGCILFEDSGSLCTEVNGVTIAVQASPWVFKFVSDGSPHYNMEVDNCVIRADTPATPAEKIAYIYAFEGDNSGVRNIIHGQSNFTSNGTFADYCKPEHRRHFRELPEIFGIESGTPLQYSNQRLDNIVDIVNLGPKYYGKKINTTGGRELVATESSPQSTWNSASTGAVVRTPKCTAADLVDIAGVMNTDDRIKFLDSRIPLDTGGFVWALGPLASDGWSLTQGGVVAHQPV